MKNELFVIAAETLRALDIEEIFATMEALKSAGLYALPYLRVDVRIAGDCSFWIGKNSLKYGNNRVLDKIFEKKLLHTDEDRVYFNFGDHFWSDFLNVSLTTMEGAKRFLTMDQGDKHFNPFSIEETFTESERDMVAGVLITLLATRNAVKERTHNKLARLGIGSNKKSMTKKYEYVTTITIPKDLDEDEEHKPSGTTRCPHLRRGHIRRQHHGPKNSLVKQIWIAPVFVNADPEWKASRAAYNVSL